MSPSSNTALTPFTFLCRRSSRLRLSITSCDILHTFVSTGLAVSRSLMGWSQLRASELSARRRRGSDRSQWPHTAKGWIRYGVLSWWREAVETEVWARRDDEYKYQNTFIKAWLKAAMLHLRSVFLSAGEITILRGNTFYYILCAYIVVPTNWFAYQHQDMSFKWITFVITFHYFSKQCWLHATTSLQQTLFQHTPGNMVLKKDDFFFSLQSCLCLIT